VVPISLLNILIVLGVVALCYANALNGEFVLDDDGCIKDNKDVTDPNQPLEAIFQNDYWGQNVLNRGSHKSWRPLTILTFRFDFSNWGLVPFGFHVTNVLLHGLVTLVFMYFCRHVCFRHTHDSLPSVVAALLFATHPVHCEAVTGIAGRADVLSGLFFLLSCLAYTCVPTGNTAADGTLSIPWAVASLFLLTASMLSKEQGITAAGIWFVYDACVSCRFLMKGGPSLTQLPSLVMNMGARAGFIVFSVFQLLGIRFSFLGDSQPDFMAVDNPAAAATDVNTRVLTQHYLASRHLWTLVWPTTLCCDYAAGSIPLVVNSTDERLLLTLASYTCLLLLVGVACFPSAASTDAMRLPLILGLAMLVLPFVPASSMFFRVGFVLAERVLYMPSFGWCILLAHAVHLLAGDHTTGPSSTPSSSAVSKKDDDAGKDTKKAAGKGKGKGAAPSSSRSPLPYGAIILSLSFSPSLSLSRSLPLSLYLSPSLLSPPPLSLSALPLSLCSPPLSLLSLCSLFLPLHPCRCNPFGRWHVRSSYRGTQQ
jgi:hypothetical protein